MDKVRTVRERKNLPDRNESSICWLGERIHGLWPLALSCTLVIVLGLCIRKSAQADMPGVITVISVITSETIEKIIKDDSGGGNINYAVIGTQFMNVTSRLSATRNSQEGRSMRGISGEIISGDLYAGLFSDTGFGYKSNADETSFFSNIGVFFARHGFFW